MKEFVSEIIQVFVFFNSNGTSITRELVILGIRVNVLLFY